MHHPQVVSNGISIDEGLAEFLPLVWRHGIKTHMSCQEQVRNDRSWVWVSFTDRLDFHDFVMVMVRALRYDIRVDISQWDMKISASYGWPGVDQFYDVRFPKEQLELVTRAFDETLQGMQRERRTPGGTPRRCRRPWGSSTSTRPEEVQP